MNKPFLKWAGGKTKLCDRINSILPKGNRLVEPFVGSGAVFLNTDFDSYYLADNNPDLINLFNHLKNDGMDFIKYSKSFFVENNNNKEVYNELRNTFNNTSDTQLKSALFIYLNRHCFNGLCRYNSKGKFNVPFGNYSKPYFPEKEMVYFLEKSNKAVFEISDFSNTMESTIIGDVVYCDPPYVPISNTANFTTYSSGGFDISQQEKLVSFSISLKERGIPVVISNHSTEWTLEHYKDGTIVEFEVQRNISCKGDSRNKVKELLVIFQ